MIDRRGMFRLAVAGLMLVSHRSLLAEEQSDDSDYEDVQTSFPPEYRPFGTKPSLFLEEETARQIHANAPTGKPLLETARYFEKINIKNGDGHMYNAQWPVRWNPVIVGFYRSANVKEDLIYKKGDTTAWCSAFINYCLLRGGYERTANAMSGSFYLYKGKQGLGKVTKNPKPGDIIIFRKTNPDEAEQGFGHVGIFIEEAPGGFMVLGGNQKAKKRYSSINTTFFPRENGDLVFHSIRSFDSIAKKS
ncbi:MAG TPA: CHAP domain-containing protein [Nitrospira sp.]|nr:CHAP domain-containing protein [Nitrospira sp.]